MNWAYLAGFVDGEGCLKTYQGYPRLTIGQKHPEVLYRVKEFLGIQNAITLSRGCYYLQIQKKSQMKEVITNMLPFLIVKRQDALEILERLNGR